MVRAVESCYPRSMTDSPSVANVLAVYNRATADQIRWGLEWYPFAHRTALAMGGGRGYHIARNAGIIAALSPMNGWNNNIRKARQVISMRGNIVIREDGSNGIGLSSNVAKAVAIYRGADPADVLNGDKVTSFYRSILNPTGDTRPTVDRHAFDIAVGERTDDKRRGILGRKGVYEEFADVYREAARIVGIGAPQMQAITWVAWRDAIGVGAHHG
jgi:hypothetical protein